MQQQLKMLAVCMALTSGTVTLLDEIQDLSYVLQSERCHVMTNDINKEVPQAVISSILFFFMAGMCLPL